MYWFRIGIEYQNQTSLDMQIMTDALTCIFGIPQISFVGNDFKFGMLRALKGISGRILRFCQVEIFVFLDATKQLYEWFSLSICPSVCLSVHHTYSLCSHHPIIMKFSGVITNERSDVHAKDQGQRLKIKVSEVKSPFRSFRTIPPVWIHIWWWNDAQSLVLLGRGALLFCKVIHQISSNIEQFL